jgi:hypothetical protein
VKRPAVDRDDAAPDSFIEAVAQRVARVLGERMADGLLTPPSSWMDQAEAVASCGSRAALQEARRATRRPVHREGKRNSFHRDELDRWRSSIDGPFAS